MANLRDFNLNFLGGDEQTHTIDGDFFRVVSASAPLQISFDNGPFVTRIVGQAQKTRQPFNRVRIKSAVAQVVSLAIGFDELLDNTAVIAGLTVNTLMAIADQNISLPAVVVGAGLTVQIAGANVKRRGIFIQSSFANDPAIIPLIGGADVTALKGLECMTGAGLPVIETTGAIYCHNPGAAAVTIRAFEINKV